MKKILLFLSAVLLFAALAGCDDQPVTTVSTAPPATTPPTTTVPETTAPPSTTVPKTTAPTTAPETTAPATTQPLNVYCDLPELTAATTPATLPEDPVLSDLVTTGYEGSACWEDGCGNIETPSFCLPSVTPFCEGAIAINQEIVDIFDPTLEQTRGYFDEKVSAWELETSYEASLNGDILSILITTVTQTDYHHYYTFAIDIATGQRIDQQALVSRVLNVSYAEFLYHATYTAYDHFYERFVGLGNPIDITNAYLSQAKTGAGYIRQYQLYLSADGTPMICNPRPGELYGSIELPYDPTARGSDPDDAGNEYYRWLFRLQPDASESTYYQEYWDTAWAQLLKTFFDLDSAKMLRYLATEDAACIDRVTGYLLKGVPEEQQDAFAAQCRSLTAHEDPAVAQLARKLLDTLSAAQQAEQERYMEAFRQVEENGYEGEAGQKLHDLCFEDTEKFLHYASQFVDPNHYDYLTSSAWASYKWAVFRNATDAERALLKETALAVYRDTKNSFELRYAASFFTPLSNKEERVMRAEALESHTEIEFQAHAAIIELNPEKAYVPQYYPAEVLFTSYEEFASFAQYHKAEEFYDSTFTSDLSPQSYDAIAAQFDEAFFEDHILLRAEVDVKTGDLPTVTKVTTGEPCYWMDRFCVHMEYTDGTSNMANPIPSDIWVVFIAVPREHYAEPIGINDYHADFNFCINGIPFQNYG